MGTVPQAAVLGMALEAELAARDDDRRAAHLDAVDAIALPIDAREELRRASDLDSLSDLDLLAEADPPVPREVHRERTGRGTRRGILGNSVRGREHPRLPLRARSGKAVHTRGREATERRVRHEPRNLVLAPERDVHMRRAEVVELDR